MSQFHLILGREKQIRMEEGKDGQREGGGFA